MATLNETPINLNQIVHFNITPLFMSIDPLLNDNSVVIKLGRLETFNLKKVHKNIEKFLLRLVLFIYELKESEIENAFFSRSKNIFIVTLKKHNAQPV